MNCGVGHRCSTDLVLLWLWYRPAVVALIRPLAWESPYAIGAALKKKKKFNFYASRDTKSEKTTQRMGENICPLSDNSLMSAAYKEMNNSKTKRQTTQLKNGQGHE